MLTAVDSQKTKLGVQLEELGQRHGHHFRFIMQAGPLKEPLYLHQDGEDFYIVPREDDTSEIPPQVDRSVGLVVAAGYKVVQQLIVHDMQGFESFEMPEREEIEVIPIDVEERVEAMQEKLTNIGKVVTGTIGALARGMAMVVSLFAVVLVDPALVLVIEQPDGNHVWIETCNWMED